MKQRLMIDVNVTCNDFFFFRERLLFNSVSPLCVFCLFGSCLGVLFYEVVYFALKIPRPWISLR